MSTEKSVLEWQVEPEEIRRMGETSNRYLDSIRGRSKLRLNPPKRNSLPWLIIGTARAVLNTATETINSAAEFLMSQDRLLRELCGISLPVPQINPGPDGSIDLFWKQPTWELLVNVPENANESASFYGEDQTGHTIKGSLDTSEPNLGVIVWLMKK